MTIANKKEPFLLLVGDLIAFILSLWITLFVRYAQAPSLELLISHFIPFSALFVIWIIVFFVAGLYEKHTVILKNKLPSIILNSQIINTACAVLFFYLAPTIAPVFAAIAPKFNLFLYLVVSFICVVSWRLYGYEYVGTKSKQKGILIGSGQEMKELFEEVNNNSRYSLEFVSSIDLDTIDNLDFQQEIIARVYAEKISIIAVDLKNEKVEPILPKLYNLIFSKIVFIDMHKIYEDIFDRVPISLVQYNWFIENISLSPRSIHAFLKRVMDIALSLFLGFFALLMYPFVFVAIKLEDGGPILISQERVGKNNKTITLYKFRSMKGNDGGRWLTENDNRHTKVGKFLRSSRIDEFPQLWNVLRGDISLIGPRPDILNLGLKLAKEIPYYNVRNIIKPGLSGWAQIHQDKPPQSVIETKLRLAYDLYYIKNRSFLLDLKIALRTLKTLVAREGM